MKKKLFQNKIAVKKSSLHGYGVFAEKMIKKGEKIEECYMLLSRGGDKTLQDFYFDANGKSATFLGYGSIYNHADEPNADYHLNLKTRIVTIKAEKTIHKGEEIFISYGDKWFSDRGLVPKQAKPVKKRRSRSKKR